MIDKLAHFLDVFTGKRAMTIFGFAMLMAFVLLLVRANRSRNSRIDLDFLFVDSSTGTITAPKFCAMGAFFASTYWLTYQLVTSELSENMLGWYLVAWSGSASVAFVMQRFGRQPPNVMDGDPSSGSTTDTTIVKREVTVTPPDAPDADSPPKPIREN